MPQQPYPPHGQHSPYGGQPGPYSPQPQPQQYGQQWVPPQPAQDGQQFGFSGGQLPPMPRQQAPKKRKKWPWIVGALVLVPILAFAGCTALVGGAISAVDSAREGGSVGLNDTYTYASGVAVSASTPQPYSSDNPYIVGSGEQGWESTVTITNGSKNPVGATLVTMNATVDNAPAERVFEGVDLATQDIAPGQSLAVPFRFKTKKGTTGPLQIAVTADFNEPVFFNGTMA
ncbi:hypothetical protein ACL02T_34775 [Pseudonocardia sp. RS010]|uniref:hypothetical protein n=1 Tax=Pseudonocardia sp. RS010 TaxID=3385979 RepID=UPI00399FAD8E